MLWFELLLLLNFCMKWLPNKNDRKHWASGNTEVTDDLVLVIFEGVAGWKPDGSILLKKWKLRK